MIKCPCTKDCPDRTAECRKTCSHGWSEYEAGRMREYDRRRVMNDEADARIEMARRRHKKGCYIK